MARVFEKICAEFGWKLKGVFGECKSVPDEADVVVFSHSLIDLDAVSTPYVAAHFIRDPRDIIVSGYLYHKRSEEAWCTNRDFDLRPPILYPRVPYSQEHRPEAWKRRYLASLGGKSYQKNLLERTESDGLLFEMNHYGAWTIEDMVQWNYDNPHVEEVRFETIMSSFDETFRRLFMRFGFSDEQLSQALQLAATEDLSRMSANQLQANPHVSSRRTTKWRSYFQEVHKETFRELFGDALIRLGYEETDQW